MYHGITYADEAYSPETIGKMTTNLWAPVMRNGIIKFIRPDQCKLHRTVKEVQMKSFGTSVMNFSGLGEFEEVK